MEITIHCPAPPSANRLWRVGKDRRTGKSYIYKDRRYSRWEWEFYLAYRRVGPPCMKSQPLITGKFDAEILISPNRPRDADNSAKKILDTCQSFGIIVNDSQARRVTQELVGRDQAPMGCKLTIKPL